MIPVSKVLTLEAVPKPKQKTDTVQLNVPRDILAGTSVLSARCGISSRARVLSAASFITNAGGNLEDFKLSQATANRKRKR